MVAAAPPSLELDPNTSSNQLQDSVAFVLLAEFDIDQGATLAHQYPYPTGTDEHALADLMLPDGAHLRAEDWTIFYLNQVPSNTVVDLLALDNTSDSGTDEGARLERARSLNGSDRGAAASGKGKGKEKQQLLYVLNCVRMKEDKALRRGARVKALAICTPHPFIQIYKPLLVLALEEYFQTPSPDILARLFDSLNSIDISAMPRLTRYEKHILRASERRDLFEEKFWAVGKTAGPPSANLEAPPATARDRAASVAFGKKIGLEEDYHPELEVESSLGHDAPISVASPPELGRPISGGSGPISPQPEASTSTLPTLPTNSAHPPGQHASASPPRSRLQSSSSHLSLASSFNHEHRSSRSPTPSTQYGHVPIHPTTPYQQHTPYQPQTPTLGGFGIGPPPPGKGKRVSKDTHFYETNAWDRDRRVPVRIPLGSFEEEVGDYSLIHLIQTFSPLNPAPPPFSAPYVPSLHTAGPSTNPIMLLFNALVTQRRVIFLGHGRAAGQVANFVLAACALGSGGGGVLRGFTARAFPYANLAGLDMLDQVPGYIAGVTNPRFEDLASRWDVLCNIETGRIIISKDIRSDPPLPSTSSTASSHAHHPSSASTANSSPVSTINSSNPFGSPTTTVGSSTPFFNTPYSSLASAFSSPSLAHTDGTDTASIMTGFTGVTDASSMRIMDQEEEKLITRAAVVNSTRQNRSDSKGGHGADSDATFMEEVQSLIASHFGEAIIRTRFADYLHRFIRLTARYEEETYGAGALPLRTWYPTVACDPKRGRLGSGALLWDGELWLGSEGAPEGRRRDSEGAAASNERRTVKEFVGVNGVKRIEGWRGTKSYELWQEDFNHSPSHRSELSFDLSHQLARLKNVTARQGIPRSEIKMIFKYLATEVRSYEAVVEVLAHVPAAWNGLLPFGFALFHDSHSVKGYMLDFFDALQQYPIGRSFLLSLNAFHRLAYRRLSDQRLIGIAEERRDMVRRALIAERERGGKKGSGPPQREMGEADESNGSASAAPLAGLGVAGLELNLGGMGLGG